jgi:hypothetical protein
MAYPGIIFRNFLWKLSLISKPFEQLWMLKYVDHQLNVDASYTRRELKWEPTPRYEIMRRLLFLLVNNKNYPNEWQNKNEAALKTTILRPNLIMYEHLRPKTEQLLHRIISDIRINEGKKLLSQYKRLTDNEMQIFISTLYHLLLATIRSGDRSLMIKYIENVAIDKFANGFEPDDMAIALRSIQNVTMNELTKSGTIKKFRQELHDYVNISIQLAIDEVENIYENLEKTIPLETLSTRISLPYYKRQHRIIRELSRPMQLHGPEEEKKQKEKKEYTLYDIR